MTENEVAAAMCATIGRNAVGAAYWTQHDSQNMGLTKVNGVEVAAGTVRAGRSLLAGVGVQWQPQPAKLAAMKTLIELVTEPARNRSLPQMDLDELMAAYHAAEQVIMAADAAG